MTKEEFLSYNNFNNKIPIRIKLNNDVIYVLNVDIDYNHTFFGVNSSEEKFPYWETNIRFNEYSLSYYKFNFILKIKKDSFEQCLTELLYWLELNKHKCKELIYYEE